jgi:hypothetical protein
MGGATHGAGFTGTQVCGQSGRLAGPPRCLQRSYVSPTLAEGRAGGDGSLRRDSMRLLSLRKPAPRELEPATSFRGQGCIAPEPCGLVTLLCVGIHGPGGLVERGQRVVPRTRCRLAVTLGLAQSLRSVDKVGQESHPLRERFPLGLPLHLTLQSGFGRPQATGRLFEACLSGT